jgi:hypothetical protein
MTLSPTIHDKAKRIAHLLTGYMRNNLSISEQDELDEWVGASDKNMHLFEELTDEHRVTLALQLLNDEEVLVKKLSDPQYTYPKITWCNKSFMTGVMVGMVVEIVLMNLK